MKFSKMEELRQTTWRVDGGSDEWDSGVPHRDNGELFALLGHELRMPLAAIRYGLELLRICGDDACTRLWVQGVLERQADQMGSLIQELLDLGLFGQKKSVLRKRPVDLAQLVGLAIESVRPAIDERGHMLHVNLPQEPVTLEVNPTLLRQVLTNLLGNAAKYTSAGGRIWLTAEVDDDEIVLRVRDTGIGISEEALPHVFDLFWQASPESTHADEGLGVGLALVRQVVEMHGGSVAAASDGLNRGSEFVVRLPCRIPEPTTMARMQG